MANRAQDYVFYHLREALVQALADIDGNETLSRYLRARSRLRLITMSKNELQELTRLVSQCTNRPAETVYKELESKIAELRQPANELLKEFEKDEPEKGMPNRVLIIENEPSLRDKLVYIFSQAGFVVSDAPDYSQALQKLYECKVDLIIIGSLLPSEDGFEACYDFHDTFNIPIIVLGQDSGDEVWEKVIRAGADHYEVKSDRYLALIARAKAILRRYQLPKAIRINEFGNGE
ncbi:MAG: response regulator [Candidatus Omnitrophica bacterium]|jgi:PleD family two-component response regulator|nr:response regulator [Candidatus Omnitrophota bacterium]